MERQNKTPLSGLTRRKLLKTAGTLALGSAVAAPFVLRPTGARASTSLVFATYGGSYGEALDRVFFHPFQRETGIQVIRSGAPDMARLKAQVQTNTMEWDLVELLPSECVMATREDLLVPIDYDRVEMPELFMPEARQSHYVSTYNYTTGIGYNSADFADTHPETWAEFWDVERFPGRRGLRSRPDNVLEIALLADGVAPADMYPLDLDRAFAALDRIKPHIARWTDTAPQTIEMIQTGELDFSHTFNNRVVAAQASGVAAGFNTRQLMIMFNAFATPVGSPNIEAAQQLLGYMMRPDLQAELWNELKLIPVTSAAVDMIPEDERLAWFPDLSTGMHLPIDADWWGAEGQFAEVTTRFREWLLS